MVSGSRSLPPAWVDHDDAPPPFWRMYASRVRFARRRLPEPKLPEQAREINEHLIALMTTEGPTIARRLRT
jgi:hypothetical protein